MVSGDRISGLRFGGLVVEHATVDENDLAGDVVGVPGRQEGDDTCDILRDGGPAQGDGGGVFLEILTDGLAVDLGQLLIDLLPHAGAHDARGIGVDGVALGCQLLCRGWVRPRTANLVVA